MNNNEFDHCLPSIHMPAIEKSVNKRMQIFNYSRGCFQGYQGHQNCLIDKVRFCHKDATIPYIMTFDVETTGLLRPCGMVQMAFCLYDVKHKQLVAYFTSYFQKPEVWDNYNMHSFWIPREKLFMDAQFFMALQEDSDDVIMAQFINWFHGVTYNKNVHLCSDNPAFDSYWINEYLKPFNINLFTIFGNYRHILDARSYLFGLTKKNPFMKKNTIYSIVYAETEHEDKNQKNILHDQLQSKAVQRNYHCALSDSYRLAVTFGEYYENFNQN